MENTSAAQTGSRSRTLTIIGAAVMILLSLTQLIPSIRLAGYSVFVGVAFFFIVEVVAKTPKQLSGLRFGSFVADLKKPGVLVWALLPVITAILPMLFGEKVLHNGFAAHVATRAGGMLTYDNLPLMLVQLIVFALGEEIAWRGFFVGKTMSRFPFWLCAVISSALFAMGHIADGAPALVIYDIFFVFVDSLIFSVVYKKSGNCLVSTASHILGNAVGVAVCLALV